MKNGIVLLSLALMTTIANAATETISGRVIDSATRTPLPNIAVRLMTKGVETYTDTLGKYTLPVSAAAVAHRGVMAIPGIALNGSIVSLNTRAGEKVRIEEFDLRGSKLHTLLNRSFASGMHTLSLANLLNPNRTSSLSLIRIQKGAHTVICTILNADNGNALQSHSLIIKSLSSVSATAVDNLEVYRKGWIAKSVDISSYTTQTLEDIAINKTAAEEAIERKVDSLLALMTINEKAGQMTMARKNQLSDDQLASLGVGSVFNGGSDPEGNNLPATWAAMIDRVQTKIMGSSRLKIPMIYGQDCVHGVGSIAGCTVFPHNIGLGCTGDTALIAKIGQITATEAVACGIRLNFAPCVASVRNERWGRTYEGFGETPEINTLMGVAYTRGLQGGGNMSQNWSVAASVKHYLGDGATDNGVNNGTASISVATMRAVHLPQYAACAREQMATVMPSFHSWTHDGQSWRQSLDKFAMTNVLKGELGFDGFCVSDWDALPQACGTGTTYSESCVAQSINAGMDMAMVVSGANATGYINAIVSGVNNNLIALSRVNDAVKRILRIKFRMNLFYNPLSSSTYRSQLYSTASRAVAREAVRKSLVLLKNQNNALPLKKTEKIAVVGQWANDLGAQCGGWTISWQGQLGAGPGIAGQTILAGLQAVGGSSNVTYSQDGSALSGADKIVVVIGEKPYAEGSGDVTVPDFSNCPNANLIQTCNSSGKPVILVMVTGRPMLIDTEIELCQAIVAAWLPGSEAGGVADVLYNDYNFTGTLTHTWPASSGQIPINTGTNYTDEQHGSGGTPLYPYGYGLHY
jgi:beta-glucosidase